MTQMDISSKASAATAMKLATREWNGRSRRDQATKAKEVKEAVEMVEAEVVVGATATRIVTTAERKGTRRRIAGRSIPRRHQSGSRKVRQTVARCR